MCAAIDTEMWTSYVENDLFSFEFTSGIDSVFLI